MLHTLSSLVATPLPPAYEADEEQRELGLVIAPALGGEAKHVQKALYMGRVCGLGTRGITVGEKGGP